MPVKSRIDSASSAGGGISTTESSKNMKARARAWHEEAVPTTKAELNSWYLYDWANSVYHSAILVMWLPVLLIVLAEKQACPYTWDEPIVTDETMVHYRRGRDHPKYVTTLSGSNVGDDFEGYYNKSTHCRYDWTAAAEASTPLWDMSTGEQFWMERGNADYGLKYLPLQQRARESFCGAREDIKVNTLDNTTCNLWGNATDDRPPGRGLLGIHGFDPRKTIPYEDKMHLTFDSAWDAFVVCDYNPASNVKFRPIRNASYYTPSGRESREFSGEKEHDGKYPGDHHFDGHDGGIIKIENITLTDDSEPVAIETITLNSTNPYLIKADKMSLVVDDVGGFIFKAKPEAFAIGATTVDIIVDGIEVMSFTICLYQMPFCPYEVSFMGINVLPIAYTTFVISASTFFQLIFFMGFAGIGDFGPYRKTILLQTGIGASILCMVTFFFKDGEDYRMAGLVTVITNLFFGASTVMYHAYLPFLTKSHPTFQAQMVQFKANKAGGAMKMGDELKKLLGCYADLQDEISAKGFAFGYVSGAIMVLVSLILIMLEPTFFGIRLIIFLSGLWWFLFSLPMIPYMEKRPGPPLPKAGLRFALTFSFKRLLASMRCLPHIPETARFVGAYFLFSDAYSTIASVGALYAIDEMGYTNLELSILCFVSPTMAALGIPFFRFVQVWRGYTNQQMILITLGIVALQVLYGICGYSGVIGLVYPVELLGLIFLYGFVLGAIQSYSRTCFVDVVPPGQESEFFGIYEISDKGSSFIGPLVCGILYQVTGTMRPSFFYLFFMSCAGWYLVYKTDMNEGAEACKRKDIQVRMEAVRKKLGVSKIQIQMNAKKFIGASSVASSAASTASSVASTVETEPKTEPKASSTRERSMMEMSKEEIHKENAIEDAPIDEMLQRASIIDKNDKNANSSMADMPRRKSSMFALRSRVAGATTDMSAHNFAPGGASERSTRRNSARKSSLLVVGEMKAGLLADLTANNKVAPAPSS